MRRKKDRTASILGDETVIALAGNPNVGKSTVFNRLTGLHQHTGNWTGKTVGCAEGICRLDDARFRIVDLPGTYSLYAHSEEEQLAGAFIRSGKADSIAVVCDATCLERNLILVLQILSLTPEVVVCVNLMDEAKKKGITVDLSALEKRLGVPVVGLSARRGAGLDQFLAALNVSDEWEGIPLRPEDEPTTLARLAEEIASEVVSVTPSRARERSQRIDRFLCSRALGFPLMFLLLLGVFWLTMTGANYPSELLGRGLFWIQDRLMDCMNVLGAPTWLSGALIMGVYRTVAWVVSVMLPPMAIFFPLFTSLEALGYLPRVAYNLDRCFHKCNACGKQALTR